MGGVPCACALLVLLEVLVLCIDSREPTSTELAENLAASDAPQHGCALGRTEPAFLCFVVSWMLFHVEGEGSLFLAGGRVSMFDASVPCASALLVLLEAQIL